MTITSEPVVSVPAVPYRGIQPFRYADHAIFFAREEETRLLTRLVAVYRGVLLYGDSGNGKSSLINAGLLPEARRMGFDPVRVRVQPRPGEELVIEQIAIAEEDGDVLPCVLAPEGAGSQQVVLSIEQFRQRVRAASQQHRPLIIFDQFEDIDTLFHDREALASRRALVQMIVGLLREPSPVKLLFAFREDYLGCVKRLLAARPELIDQTLRLGGPSADALQTIIRGPFERFPGHYERELDATLAQRLAAELAERFGTGEISLSEVQTVCLRLWQSPDPHTLLADKSVRGLLEDELSHALEAFPREERSAAIALLSQMITDAGTRNVISADDLCQRVHDDDPDIPPPLVDDALQRLERDSKLVRHQRRRDIDLYEITSEFLVPWISQRREELRLAHERQRERRRLRILGSITAGLLIIAALITALAIDARHQRNEARHQAKQASALALASSASALLDSRPDVSSLLALAAYRTTPRAETRGSAIAARAAVGGPGVLAILHGHGDSVDAVAFSPDGRMFASAGADDTVRLWDARSHRQLGAPIRGHRRSVFGVAFSPDGRTLASASQDNTIGLWDVHTHKRVGTLIGHGKTVYDVAFSPDGRTLASASEDKMIGLWDVHTHRRVGTLTGHTSAVFGVAFSPDGRTLASGGGDLMAPGRGDRTIRLWDVRAQKQRGTLNGHRKSVEKVAFGPDGRTLASSGADGTVRLWDVRAQKQLGTLTGHTGAVFGVAFSRDGRRLASAGADKTVRLWDVRARTPVGEPLKGHTNAVAGVAFSPDARTLASASGDNTVRLWNVHTPDPRGMPLRGHAGYAVSVAFSPDGRTLASGGGDRMVRLWDPRTHKPLGTLTGNGDAVESVAFSPEGRTLASAGKDGTVQLWDARTHRSLGRPLTGHAGEVNSVAFSGDGRILASAGKDGTVRLWDARAQKPLGRLTGHTGSVESVAFSPDRRTLASSGQDATVRLWDARTHKLLGRLTGHSGPVYGVAFSSDGQTLASSGADGTVRLWDVGNRTLLGRPLTHHTGAVYSVAFSPDGRTLASAGADATVRLRENILWRTTAELRSEVCKLVGSGLSTAEWEQFAGGNRFRRTCP